MKQAYIQEFKISYLQSFLLKSYNSSEEVKHLLTIDKSNYSEPILTIADRYLIDSLTTLDNIKLNVDSINSIGTVAEGAEGKRILNHILKKMESKWLDKLARQRYRHSNIRW